MPKHRSKDFVKLLQIADLPGDEDAKELVELLNKGMFELAIYGHLVVGSLVLVGTHFRRISNLLKDFIRKKGYCKEKKRRSLIKARSETWQID